MAASEPTIDNQELVKGVFEDLEKGRMVEVSEVEENINLEQKFLSDFSIQTALEQF